MTYVFLNSKYAVMVLMVLINIFLDAIASNLGVCYTALYKLYLRIVKTYDYSYCLNQINHYEKFTVLPYLISIVCN